MTYNSSVHIMYVTEILLSDLTEFYEIICVCLRRLSAFLNGLDLQLCPIVPTRRGAHTRILRFTMEIEHFLFINGFYWLHSLHFYSLQIIIACNIRKY